MSRAATQIDQQMRALVRGPQWNLVPGSYYGRITILATKVIETPEYSRGEGFGRWPDATYERHLFVTLTWSGVVLGDAPAPWVGRRDYGVPYWFAQMVLDADDPFTVLDQYARIKDERRARTQATELKNRAARS
jgi:hypothetical protein